MIWVLLVIGLLLIIFNIRAINKEKNSFKYVFNNTEEDMKEFDFKLSELRREFSETILELQKEIVNIKETYTYENEEPVNITLEETKDVVEINDEYIEDNSIIEEEVEEEEKAYDKVENTIFEQKNEIENNNIKINEINILLSQGLSLEEISEKLGIGKGEVLLIKELYLK